MIDPSKCPSFHGGAGYTMGDYWDGDAIVCCLCGTRIEDPNPTSRTITHYSLSENPVKFLLGTDKPEDEWIPHWPPWILGARGQPALKDRPSQDVLWQNYLAERLL